MGKTGKISSIKKEYRNNGSLEASLSNAGYGRFPGTGVRFVPYKEANGEYRTGLNVDSNQMKRLKLVDKKAYDEEYERISKLREHFESIAGVDLGPRSDYYSKIFDDRAVAKANIVRLKEGDNMFHLEDIWQAITYEWIKVHPLIASSYAAYERGEYPSNTQFYVNDENIEEDRKYKKKIVINKAIGILDSLSVEKRKKVARLLGLPVTDNSKEVVVYNALDTFIKASEIKDGENKGMNPVELFSKFAGMEDKLINMKDLVNQALKNTIYRTTRGGRITEGNVEIAKSKEELVEFLLNPENQDDLLALQEKLKRKKILVV